ncbi:MAG: hypothetical protein FHP92_20595 [Denitromonas halophila]|nr:MAG: hypothetical protein FHP92_20595 [Denitromonas halophila]
MLRHDEFVGKLSSDNNFFALNIIRHADDVKKMTVWMVLASMSFVASFFVTPWVSNLMLGMTMLASALGVKYMGSAEYMKDCAEKALERSERR